MCDLIIVGSSIDSASSESVGTSFFRGDEGRVVEVDATFVALVVVVDMRLNGFLVVVLPP